MNIIPGDLSNPSLIALLDTHVRTARAATAPGSAHALDHNGLAAPDIELWTIMSGDEPVCVGALRILTPDHGELKSMHTAQTHRRHGYAAAMLRHLIDRARTRGLSRLSLETGAWDYFKPAHALYLAHGFRFCGPFGDYRADPNSLFLNLSLA